jgi:hypothetical protein
VLPPKLTDEMKNLWTWEVFSCLDVIVLLFADDENDIFSDKRVNINEQSKGRHV